MNFNDAIASGYRNYLNPRGRASRSAYWYFILFVVLLMILITVGAAIIATNLIPDASSLEDGSASGIVASFTLIVVGIYIFAFGIPALMLMVRRFHDVGLSGAYVFGIFFAGVGARFYSDSLVAAGNTAQTSILIAIANLASLAGLVVTLWPSQGGVNKYGAPEIK